MYRIIIYGTLPSLNEYTRANRANRHAGANMKKKAEELITNHIRAQVPDLKIKGAVGVQFAWIEPNSRKDLDNVAFAKKFILDALVKNEVIEGDDRKHVKHFIDLFPEPDKVNPRIEVEIYPMGE